MSCSQPSPPWPERPHLAVRIDHRPAASGAAPAGPFGSCAGSAGKAQAPDADVANTLPWEPAASTAMDAMSTMIYKGRWRSWGAEPSAEGWPPPGLRRMWTDGRTQSARHGLVPQSTQPNPSLGTAAQHLITLHSRPHQPRALMPRGQVGKTSRKELVLHLCLPTYPTGPHQSHRRASGQT